MKIEPVAYFHSPFTSKFGIPRQSGIVKELKGTLVFTGQYAQREALSGIEAYDYLWLIWGFSENVEAEKHAMVRPPLLGGNEKMGVWATRSPFRPNNLGLSSVRILAVRPEVPCIEVAGADLMDGTPVYDIKPYLPYSDSHPEARSGFVDQSSWQELEVHIPETFQQKFTSTELDSLKRILALDPRPHYQDDPERIYGMPFGSYDIRFKVEGLSLYVVDCVKTVSP
jgi:tRNA-Thr(GGU) m(6)t(6)A37 methyltransferase TsaA